MGVEESDAAGQQLHQFAVNQARHAKTMAIKYTETKLR